MIPTRERWREALAERHGKELQTKLEKATVAVCGLGGLGSNVAICLARAGVGTLILIDYDRVDLTNLHRQQYKADQIGMPKVEALAGNLREIAPYAELRGHDVKMDVSNLEELLRDADIVVEAFDKAEAKAMLVNGVLEAFPEKRVVSGSGMAGLGSANSIRTRRVGSRLVLCGDGTSDVEEAGSLFAARVMLCAAHEALAVIRWIAGLDPLGKDV